MIMYGSKILYMYLHHALAHYSETLKNAWKLIHSSQKDFTKWLEIYMKYSNHRIVSQVNHYCWNKSV